MAENMEALPEEVLIQRAQAQDYDAMDALMQRYKGIVRKRARSLFIIGGDQDDLMQEGMIGLFKAIQDYDKSKEAVFSTFAELCISRQLYSAVKIFRSTPMCPSTRRCIRSRGRRQKAVLWWIIRWKRRSLALRRF